MGCGRRIGTMWCTCDAQRTGVVPSTNTLRANVTPRTRGIDRALGQATRRFFSRLIRKTPSVHPSRCASNRLQRARAMWAFACAVFALALFILGGTPYAVGVVPSPWDKLVHSAAFAVLTLLLFRTLGARTWT